MTQSLDLDKRSRLLILVPHPDDETLATGGLIQSALAANATLRVVIVTDGDDNPWPQRWIEKRWRIDPAARQRWGVRRRHEADEALTRLGIRAEDVRHYGWPDQSLTAQLMRDSRCEDQLAAEIEGFAPTLIVVPSLSDLHPDHNALRVMFELAVVRTKFADSRRLGYVVHGRLATGENLTVAANNDRTQKKRFALQAHVSQLVLSAKRMNEICRRVERFEDNDKFFSDAVVANHREWQMIDSRPAISLHRRALYLIVNVCGRVLRTSLPLPRRAECLDMKIDNTGEDSIRIQMTKADHQIHINLTSDQVITQVYAKIERLGSRIFIYDANGWQLVD